MRSTEDILGEIREVAGTVPVFLQRLADYNPELLENGWEFVKALQIEESRIPAKYRELIGLAVAGAVHCKFCTVAHTEFAKLCGASDEEITEAANLARFTAGWSAFVDACQLDIEDLKKDLKLIREHMLRQPAGVR